MVPTVRADTRAGDLDETRQRPTPVARPRIADAPFAAGWVGFVLTPCRAGLAGRQRQPAIAAQQDATPDIPRDSPSPTRCGALIVSTTRSASEGAAGNWLGLPGCSDCISVSMHPRVVGAGFLA